MIYVSSSCSPQRTIKAAILELVEKGYTNIELSGGTEFDADYKIHLLELKEKYDLNLMVHNYFPPPQKDFVLNLASFDDEIYQLSCEQLKTGFELTRVLGGERISVHAGFFVDPPAAELGRVFSKNRLSDPKQAETRFFETLENFKAAFPDITLYVENNCYSVSNFQVYGDDFPFMLLTADDYISVSKKVNVDLLLDTGHLKVCCDTLELDFNQQLQFLFEITDYIHVSDNDGKHDQNLGLKKASSLFEQLSLLNWKKKVVTLEVYEGWDALERTYSLINQLKKQGL